MEKDILEHNTIRSQDTLYVIQHLIGMGRFSRVYQAIDWTTKDMVVIKALNGKNINEHFDRYLYLKELGLLTKLKTSSLRARYVDLKDAIRLETGRICFVMEKLGTTLHAVLHNIGGLPMSMCRPIVRQIAQGRYIK